MAQNITMTSANLPLRDIHLPDPVGWWPLAPGWWALCGLLILLLVFLWGGRRFWQRRRLRHLALKKLEELSALPDAELVTALSRLLRQTAISHFPRQDCAGLSGQAWLDFLNQPFDDRPFNSGVGCCLSDAPYQRETQIDASALVDLCRRWLKKLPPQSLNLRRKL
ncbi:MAG: DUF4381 domain-containing protein [Desulfuromusa sp.]|nr:DUF4381 domain-containing protein [Desulfuromusa sp.]